MTKKWQQPSVPHVLAKTLFMVNIYINKAVTRRVHFPSHMNQDREGIQTRGAYGPGYPLSPNVHTQHTHTNTNITCTTHSTHTQTHHTKYTPTHTHATHIPTHSYIIYKIHTNTPPHPHAAFRGVLAEGLQYHSVLARLFRCGEMGTREVMARVRRSVPPGGFQGTVSPLLRPLCPTQRVQTSQLNSTCASCYGTVTPRPSSQKVCTCLSPHIAPPTQGRHVTLLDVNPFTAGPDLAPS